MQRINSGALSADDQTQIKSLLGLDPNGPIYGSRDQILSALTQGIQEGKYNSSNVANQDQYAAQQALSQLTGQTGQQLGLNIDQAQVGKAGPALYANDAIKNQLATSQQQGADRFADQYKKSGILSQKELDYLNSQGLQDQFGGIGGALNAYDQQDNEGKDRAMTQAHNSEQDILGKLAAYDKQNGESGFGGIQNSIADIGNYNGQRSYNRGEGVSQFLANIKGQQDQRQKLEKNNQYFNNLSSLLASKATPSSGNTAF